MTPLCSVVLAVVAHAHPGQATPEDPLYPLEQLYAAGAWEEGLGAARQRLAADPADPDVYWHVSRFLYEVAEAAEPGDPGVDREALYTEMLAVAEAGLAVDPDNPQTRFSRAVARGRLATTRGVLASLWAARDIERDMRFAAESGLVYSSLDGRVQLPCDAHQGLGIFYRLVPDSWVVQLLAGTRGSLERSHQHLTIANDACPNRIATMKELAATELCRAGGADAEATALIEALLALPPADDKDRIDQRHAQRLLADPSLACGYSRDRQQDRSVEGLESRGRPPG